jgi:chorismate mutase
LCLLSEFYFLNRSSAKQSANSSDELTCDHDKNTLIEYKDMVKELEHKLVDLEERRAGLETQVANVQYLPRLVQGRTRIEELKEELHREEEEYAANLKRESKNHREITNQLTMVLPYYVQSTFSLSLSANVYYFILEY